MIEAMDPRERRVNPGMPFGDYWRLADVKPDGGPTMTMEGTMAKLLVLVCIFAAGFFLSWSHFHSLYLAATPDQVHDIVTKEVPAWQGNWFFTLANYPAYALLLFLVAVGSAFVTKKGLVVVAPVCVAIEGVSLGAVEYILMGQYPGITLLCGTAVIGVFLGLYLIYWPGLATVENPIALFLAGAVGGLLFTYVGVFVIRSYGLDAPYLHQAAAGLGVREWWFLGAYITGCGLVVSTFASIEQAVDAGVPKWVEWRAAVCLFAWFLVLAKLLRRVLLRRQMWKLAWDVVGAAQPGSRR